MGVIAEGILKNVRYKKEVSWGVLPGQTGGKQLRRVTSNFNLVKETYQSNEIRVDYQMIDFRHGVRSVEGSLNGELSPGSYSDFFSAILAKDFAIGATTGPQTTIGTTANSITRTAGSFITDGFKIGEIVRATGLAATANNNKNLLVTSVTALTLGVIALDGLPLAVAAAGPSVTVSMVGKKCFTPLSGHTDTSFTVEEWYSDIAQSEVSTGVKIGSMAVQLPASGLATVDITFMGKDHEVTGSSEYFTAPTAPTSTGICAAANGYLLVGGQAVGLVTGLNFTINRNLSMEGVVGFNTVPDIFEGRVLVDGEFSAFFKDRTYSDIFRNETETSLVVVLTTNNQPNADFVVFSLPRIKINTDTKDDGEIGIKQSLGFQALLNVSNPNSTEQTTLVVQDSQA